MEPAGNAKPSDGAKGGKGKPETPKDSKGKATGEEQPQKSKAQLKAERRALQVDFALSFMQNLFYMNKEIKIVGQTKNSLQRSFSSNR